MTLDSRMVLKLILMMLTLTSFCLMLMMLTMVLTLMLVQQGAVILSKLRFLALPCFTAPSRVAALTIIGFIHMFADLIIVWLTDTTFQQEELTFKKSSASNNVGPVRFMNFTALNRRSQFTDVPGACQGTCSNQRLTKTAFLVAVASAWAPMIESMILLRLGSDFYHPPYMMHPRLAYLAPRVVNAAEELQRAIPQKAAICT